jgi:hypothetical protein
MNDDTLQEMIRRRDYLFRALLEHLKEAIPPRGHVRRGSVQPIHSFFETQYHAMLKRELKEAEHGDETKLSAV